jgi:hypothetical protein
MEYPQRSGRSSTDLCVLLGFCSKHRAPTSFVFGYALARLHECSVRLFFIVLLPSMLNSRSAPAGSGLDTFRLCRL